MGTLNRNFPLRRLSEKEENMDLSTVDPQPGRPWIDEYYERQERLRSINPTPSIYDPPSR